MNIKELNRTLILDIVIRLYHTIPICKSNFPINNFVPFYDSSFRSINASVTILPLFNATKKKKEIINIGTLTTYS